MADVSVRTARAADAAAVAAIQRATWLAAYAAELPDGAFADHVGSLDDLAASWRDSIVFPPSARHHVLVALDRDEPVGVVAFGPAEDDDTDPTRDAEIVTFVVAEGHRGAGHGSRLLAAAVDHLTRDGFARATTWIDATDEAARAFLTASGWEPDGSFRTLDLEGDGHVVLRQVRLHTDVTQES